MENFEDKIRSLWGAPREVVEEALNEIFRFFTSDLDHDDQVRNAIDMGLMVGSSGSADEFLMKFHLWKTEEH